MRPILIASVLTAVFASCDDTQLQERRTRGTAGGVSAAATVSAATAVSSATAAVYLSNSSRILSNSPIPNSSRIPSSPRRKPTPSRLRPWPLDPRYGRYESQPARRAVYFGRAVPHAQVQHRRR